MGDQGFFLFQHIWEGLSSHWPPQGRVHRMSHAGHLQVILLLWGSQLGTAPPTQAAQVSFLVFVLSGNACELWSHCFSPEDCVWLEQLQGCGWGAQGKTQNTEVTAVESEPFFFFSFFLFIFYFFLFPGLKHCSSSAYESLCALGEEGREV